MNYYHEVTTALGMGDFSDKEMIGAILDKMKSSGYTALTIVEVFGDFTTEQLEALVNDPANYNKLKYSPLFIDRKEVERAILSE